MYKVEYSQIISYKEMKFVEKFSMPCVEMVEHHNKKIEGYCDEGYNTMNEAQKRVEELKSISNKTYTDIKIVEC